MYIYIQIYRYIYICIYITRYIVLLTRDRLFDSVFKQRPTQTEILEQTSSFESFALPFYHGLHGFSSTSRTTLFLITRASGF